MRTVEAMLLERHCLGCGRPGPPLCGRCAERLRPAPDVDVSGVGDCRSLFAYEGSGRDLVLAFKYRDGRSLAAVFAEALAPLVAAVDVLVPMPAVAAHRRRRGYDPSAVLARALGHRIRRPVVPALRRLDARPQTDRLGADRRAGPQLKLVRDGPGRVALVDDVVTTGASLAAAAATLAPGRWQPCQALTVAATPGPAEAAGVGLEPSPLATDGYRHVRS